jgi:hypothetical protein
MSSAQLSQMILGSMRLIIGTVSLICGLIIPSTATSAQESSARIHGYFVCLNNPAPECRNPDRQISGDFVCLNNPGPACNSPQPPDRSLEPGSYDCLMNQNTACQNPRRYSVEQPEVWENAFGRTENSQEE